MSGRPRPCASLDGDGAGGPALRRRRPGRERRKGLRGRNARPHLSGGARLCRSSRAREARPRRGSAAAHRRVGVSWRTSRSPALKKLKNGERRRHHGDHRAEGHGRNHVSLPDLRAGLGRLDGGKIRPSRGPACRLRHGAWRFRFFFIRINRLRRSRGRRKTAEIGRKQAPWPHSAPAPAGGPKPRLAASREAPALAPGSPLFPGIWSASARRAYSAPARRR